MNCPQVHTLVILALKHSRKQFALRLPVACSPESEPQMTARCVPIIEALIRREGQSVGALCLAQRIVDETVRKRWKGDADCHIAIDREIRRIEGE